MAAGFETQPEQALASDTAIETQTLKMSPIAVIETQPTEALISAASTEMQASETDSAVALEAQLTGTLSSAVAVETQALNALVPVAATHWNSTVMDPNTIYVDCEEGRLESNTALLAGYLGLPDSRALRSLVRSESVKAALEKFESARNNQFNLSGTPKEKKAKCIVKMSTIMESVRDSSYTQYLTAAIRNT